MYWQHDSAYVKPSMEILSDAVVAPLTYLELASDTKFGRFDGGVYYNGGKICELGLHIKCAYHNTPCLNPNVKEYLGGRHVFGGMLQNWHFGHFITESLSRIWATHLVSDIQSIVFYRRHPEIAKLPKYALDLFAIVLPNVPVTIIRQPTCIETLIVPSQLVNKKVGMLYGQRLVRDMLLSAYGDPTGMPKSVFVSRAKLGRGVGSIVCESVLEENLVQAGYTVVYPETMKLDEQIRLYRSADSLIFTEGSALHLYAIVAQPNQKVFVVRRRTPLVGAFDWQVSSFGGPKLQGEPCLSRLYVPQQDGSNQVHARAVLDFDALRAQLQAGGFLAASTWRSPTQEEIDSAVSTATEMQILDFPRNQS